MMHCLGPLGAELLKVVMEWKPMPMVAVENGEIFGRDKTELLKEST
jgi:hypothetical protein